MNKENIPVIPVTGPPCSGKTSILACIREELFSMGHTPIIIPETATAIFGMGLDKSLLQTIELQKQIFEYQMMQENYMLRYAEHILHHCNKKPVIICDRSLLDGQAYVGKNKWEIILDEMNVQQTTIGHRYNGSIYLEIAPREFYTLETNQFRDETYEQSFELGEKIKEAYLVNHPWIVTNRKDFKTKKSDAATNLKHILGYPEPIEDELKFKVLSDFSPKDIPVPYVRSEITQHYLLNVDLYNVERIRQRRFDDGVTIFTHTIKNRQTKVEREQMISRRYYVELFAKKIPGKVPVIKDRYCFIWENQYFELDFFKNISRDPLLELERTKLQTEYKIPNWIGSVKDVTNDSEQNNENF